MTPNQGFFRGRPLGSFDFCSLGSFFGRLRFIGFGRGTGIDNPNASSSSNTMVMVRTQQSLSVCDFSGESAIRHAKLRSSIRSLYDIMFIRPFSRALAIIQHVADVAIKLMNLDSKGKVFLYICLV